MLEIMIPTNPRWKEFAERLEGPEGCNFRYLEPGQPASIRWECDNMEVRPLARAILEKIGGIDLEATFKFFDSAGGHCDCEICFNVNPENND